MFYQWGIITELRGTGWALHVPTAGTLKRVVNDLLPPRCLIILNLQPDAFVWQVNGITHPYDTVIILMLAHNDNTIQVPPSNKSINHVDEHINFCSKQLNSYTTFLYNEATRISSRLVTLQEIQSFIQTPEGQKGLKAYISMSKPSRPIVTPKAVGQVLGGIL